MGVVHNLILGGGGASLPTTLNVTVSGGTATSVTASLGSRSVSLAYDSTSALWSATLPKNATGNWTVTATDGSKTVSDLVAISGPGIWSMELALGPLPSGYTELEYIESSGMQYINTGFIPDFQTVKIELNNFTPLSQKAWLCFFGVCEADSSSDYTNIFLRWLSTDGIIGSLVGSWKDNTHPANYQYSNPAGTKINSLSLDKDELIVNGSLAQYIYTSTKSASSRNLFIFGCNKAGSFWRGSSMRCGNVKCYTSDVLQRDFIPARRNSDSVLGMYDIVTNTFYTNAGSGSFIAGPDV